MSELVLSPNFSIYGFREGARLLEVSDDLGATWRHVGASPWSAEDRDRQRRVVDAMAVHGLGDASDTLFVRIADRLKGGPGGYGDLVGTTSRSTDGGQTWEPIQAVLPDLQVDRSSLLSPSGGSVLLWTQWEWVESVQTSVPRVWRSDDAGATWRTILPPESLRPIRGLSDLADGGIMVTASDDTLHVQALGDFRDGPSPAGPSRGDRSAHGAARRSRLGATRGRLHAHL